MGTLTLNNTIVSGNRTGGGNSCCGGNGGGISNYLGTLTLNNSIVSGNLTGTPLDNNTPGGVGGSGGGIATIGGMLTLNNSTVSDNSTDNGSNGGSVGGNGGSGGGIATTAGTLTMNNSTVSDNLTGISDAGGDGGAVYNSQYNTVNISDTTIAFNSVDIAQIGGGIANSGGTVNVKNTLLAYNQNANGITFLQDCSGTVSSLGYNVMMEPDCTIVAATGDQFYVRGSILGPLQNNGGPTQTHALLPGSPAIDAADDSICPSTDQRGFPRPAFGGKSLRCDVGAYELEQMVYLPIIVR